MLQLQVNADLADIDHPYFCPNIEGLVCTRPPWVLVTPAPESGEYKEYKLLLI